MRGDHDPGGGPLTVDRCILRETSAAFWTDREFLKGFGGITVTSAPAAESEFIDVKDTQPRPMELGDA